MKKRLIALFMAMLLVLGSSLTAYAAEEGSTLDGLVDVAKTEKYEVVRTYDQGECVRTNVDITCDLYEYTVINEALANLKEDVDTNTLVEIHASGEGEVWIHPATIAKLTAVEAGLNFFVNDTSTVVSWHPVSSEGEFVFTEMGNEKIEKILEEVKMKGVVFHAEAVNGDVNCEFYTDFSYGVLNGAIESKYMYYFDVQSEKFVMTADACEAITEGTNSRGIFTGDAFPFDGNYVMVDKELPEELIKVEEPKKLDTPQVTISDDGILTLTGVEHTDRYDVYLGFAFVGESQYHSMYQFHVFQADLKDGKYTYDIKKNVENSPFATYDGSVNATVIALGLGENEYEDSEYGRSNAWEYRIPVEKAEEQLDEALDSEDPADAKDVLTGLSNETVVEIMKEDITKVEKAEEAWAEEKAIKVESKSEVESVDASKVTIVGAALNANGDDEKEVILSIKEPEKKVEVEEKYTNTVALDIKLFVEGESKTDLAVPVAITMPIPAGVETKDLVILHYHNDAEEPAVIVPTVNEDGTMTFFVGGFSTFVVANQTVIDAPATGDMNYVAMACFMLLIGAGVVLIKKRNVLVK